MRLSGFCGTTTYASSDDIAGLLGSWIHAVFIFPGGDFTAPGWYINGASATGVDNIGAGPQTISGTGFEMGGGGALPSFAGYMCDIAVWDKELSADEITEIYGAGKRVYLKGTTCRSNLLSWWMLGSDTRDTYNGIIYDQQGSRDAVPYNLEAADITDVSPNFVPNYRVLDAGNNKNIYWHRYIEEVNLASRQGIFDTVKSTFDRLVSSPVKFGIEGTTAIGGVAKHHNSVVNYIFNAARAWGKLGPRVSSRGRPVINKLVSSGSSVEKLIESPEDFYPTFKQRLGFGLSSSNGIAVSGPRHAPFSLYSSSVTTGFNAEVIANYASGVMITNLHNDFVIDTDVPMQGPFTEKYVGGRFYRHTALNKGTDTNQTRAEGFRIEFDNGGSKSVLGVSKKSLVILPPNSRSGSTDPGASLNGPAHWPTAYRFRGVTAKRPVNIKNIQMTTGSTIIGNYEKNYQVVNTNSRMKNDLFFNDQSFNFALYPETLATRGRFPLFLPLVSDWVPKTLLFSDDAETVNGGNAATWAGYLDSGAFSISFWFRFTNAIANTYEIILNLGEVDIGQDSITVFLQGVGVADNRMIAQFRDSAGGVSHISSLASAALSNDTWYHTTIVFRSDSMTGAGTKYPDIYINGARVSDSGARSNLATWGNDFGDGMILGEINQPAGSANNYKGYLADVAIFNANLSSGHAAALYNLGSRVNIKSTGIGGLVTWWTLGSTLNDSAVGTLYNEVAGNVNATPSGFSTAGLSTESPPGATGWDPYINTPPYNATANPGGNLNYALPERTGSNSNQTVIVNRYAGSGYEVMSLGYMDPAHEELSVYNANPYHNLAIIDHGLSGNVAAAREGCPAPLQGVPITPRRSMITASSSMLSHSLNNNTPGSLRLWLLVPSSVQL